MSLYYLGNSRSQEQSDEMSRLEEAGVCIFCPEHVPGTEILHRTAHWIARHNRWPYNGSKHHLLLTPDEHVSDLLDLSVPAQQDFWTVLGWVREHYDLRYYGLGARNGEPRYTGGTIFHLHVHVLVGDVDDPDHTGVRVRLSSRPR